MMKVVGWLPSSALVGAALGCVLVSAALSAAQQGSTKPTPPPKGKPAVPAVEPVNYLIGSGDVLQLFVWKEPDLTRDVTVRFDGKISVPLLGDVEAAGRTPQDLGKDLGEKLGRFVEAPVVTVAVTQPNSARFFVLGQVASPGGYPLIGRVSVLQALALAGGFKDFAKSDKIVIVRGDDSQKTLSVNYKKLEDGSELAQNVSLQPGDTILVP